MQCKLCSPTLSPTMFTLNVFSGVSSAESCCCTQKKFGINLALVSVSGVPPVCQTQKSSHLIL